MNRYLSLCVEKALVLVQRSIQNSNFCETGFAETSALFLLEGYRKNVTIHSFDMNPGNVNVKQLLVHFSVLKDLNFTLGT